jgi:predicted aminopeptidase
MSSANFTLFDDRSGKWHAYYNNQKLIGEYNTRRDAAAALDDVVRKRVEAVYSQPTFPNLRPTNRNAPPPAKIDGRQQRLAKLRKKRKLQL